jgi:hypothetical protein
MFSNSELQRLRGRAVAFFTLTGSIYKSYLKGFMEIRNLEELKQKSERQVFIADPRYDKGQKADVWFPGVWAIYSIDGDKVELISLYSKNHKLMFKFLDGEISSISYGKENKSLENLIKFPSYGWVYYQPLTNLPSVTLNPTGGFRAFT